ncbi:MAG: Crp/Fnr family transcriptional regulator [Cyclobacteriaceae bacterium]|nr:Crp/Fnr family transcriptional regulator [Cyclobacteriaceae bacterium]
MQPMDIFKTFDAIYSTGPEAKKAMGAIIQEREFSKNELVQKPGSTCRTLYFVKSGAARIFYFKDGNDITEHFAFANDLIVRAESLFTGAPTRKGIESLEKTHMIAIDAALLIQLYDTHPDIERLFRLIIEKEFVNAIKRIESFQLMSATERYVELLHTTDIVQKIPLKNIASYLGITQVSLSRIRAEIR